MSQRIFTALLLSSLLYACGKKEEQPPPDGGEEEFIPTTNAEHNLMLGQLGFKTDIGARLDPSGVPVAPTWHPLKKKFSSFNPRHELYIGGVTFENAREHLFEDGSKAWAGLPITVKDDSSWAGANLKNGVSGDFDADGLEEILIVYFVEANKNLKYILLNVDGSEVKEGMLELSADPTGLDVRHQPALAAGDLDGDGHEEVAVGFSKVYLVDHLEGTPAVSTLALQGQDLNDAFVAIGNVDWDGQDELVVTYTTGNVAVGHYAIYDGISVAPTQTGELSFRDSNNVLHVATDTQIAIGDVDGDRLGEIVFAGRETNAVWSLFALEYDRPAPGDGTLFDWRALYYVPGWVSWDIPRPLFTLDWEGDGRQEVFFGAYVYRITREYTPTLVNVGLGAILNRAVAANIDAERGDEIIFEWSGNVFAQGLNALAQPVTKKSWAGTFTPWYSPILAPVNMDRDSPVVRYDGEYELLFTNPHIVAVLAAPPYRADIGQNVDATATTFGKSFGQTVEEETALGFTVGASVGYEADFAFFGGVEMMVNFDTAMDFISGESMTIEKYHAYTTGPGEDKVVFTTVPFDVYYYQIISSPDERDVGRSVTINIPRDPQTLAATRDFYNAHNGGGLDVDGAIVGHTPGDVASYPTLARRDQILNDAVVREPSYQKLWNGPMTVCEGGGFDLLGISSTAGSRNSTSMDFNVEFEFTATSPGGAKTGASVGFHYGHTYTFATEDTAFFEGTVGCIPSANYNAQNRYQYGLFVYPESAGGQKFLVMNYWQEP